MQMQRCKYGDANERAKERRRTAALFARRSSIGAKALAGEARPSRDGRVHCPKFTNVSQLVKHRFDLRGNDITRPYIERLTANIDWSSRGWNARWLTNDPKVEPFESGTAEREKRDFFELSVGHPRIFMPFIYIFNKLWIIFIIFFTKLWIFNLVGFVFSKLRVFALCVTIFFLNVP